MSGTTQPFAPTEVVEQGQPLEEVPNGNITGEEAMDQRSKTHDAGVTDVNMDLGEGTSEAAAVLSGSDPAPSANKPKPKSAFVKITELKEKEMLEVYVEAFFDHFIYYKKSGGDLHGNISTDTIIYLEEPKKGGLLHFDPPVKMPGDFKPCRRQRWIPELEYDENGEVILANSKPRTTQHQARQYRRGNAYGGGLGYSY